MKNIINVTCNELLLLTLLSHQQFFFTTTVTGHCSPRQGLLEATSTWTSAQTIVGPHAQIEEQITSNKEAFRFWFLDATIAKNIWRWSITAGFHLCDAYRFPITAPAIWLSLYIIPHFHGRLVDLMWTQSCTLLQASGQCASSSWSGWSRIFSNCCPIRTRSWISWESYIKLSLAVGFLPI